MSEKIELRPCPLCGNAPKKYTVGGRTIKDDGYNAVYGCQNEQCPIHVEWLDIDGRKYIRNHAFLWQWNRRPIEDAQAARIAELERTVDDLRGELAQSDRAADKTRIAELEAALRQIRNWDFMLIDPPVWEDGLLKERRIFTLDDARKLAEDALEASK